jgi:hypothetical protein
MWPAERSRLLGHRSLLGEATRRHGPGTQRVAISSHTEEHFDIHSREQIPVEVFELRNRVGNPTSSAPVRSPLQANFSHRNVRERQGMVSRHHQRREAQFDGLQRAAAPCRNRLIIESPFGFIDE